MPFWAAWLMRPRSEANSCSVPLPLVCGWRAPCWMRSTFSFGKYRYNVNVLSIVPRKISRCEGCWKHLFTLIRNPKRPKRVTISWRWIVEHWDTNVRLEFRLKKPQSVFPNPWYTLWLELLAWRKRVGLMSARKGDIGTWIMRVLEIEFHHIIVWLYQRTGGSLFDKSI